jgi:hypothetical protein
VSRTPPENNSAKLETGTHPARATVVKTVWLSYDLGVRGDYEGLLPLRFDDGTPGNGV